MTMETKDHFSLEFPEQFDYVAQEIENTQTWEPRTTEFIKGILKPGMHFVDIGAQVGYFTLLAASLGAKVTAFEPSTLNRGFLVKNIETNKFPDITVYPNALSNIEGKVKLYTGKTPGENSLVGQGDSELVDAVRFDDLGIPVPDVIKMDIEGAERLALEGMQSILNTDKEIYLIIEDWYNEDADWLIDNYKFELITTDRASGNRILAKNRKSNLIIPNYEFEEPLRIHLLGPFNTPTTLKPEGIGNAFATKVIKMARILKKLGYYVIFYGVEGSEVECDEFVQVSTKEILVKAYGPWDPETVYACERQDYAHRMFIKNATEEILKRKRFCDFLLCSQGSYHQPIADKVQIYNTVEIGIGYTGSFAKFRIFESEFQRNWSYGAEGKGDGEFYDAVIPGYFDPNDFEFSDVKEDYYLYLGRIIKRKGVLIARDVCKTLGKKLIVAGFGHKDSGVDGETFREILNSPNVEYVGFADYEKRKKLLSKAKALFMPTQYLEPFGYVALEANFSGTPVITTDFGAFPETVRNGVNGYRCRTFKEFVNVAKNIDKEVSPSSCRNWAMMNYTIEEAIPKYKRFFDQILDLYGKGWYKI